MPLWTFLNVISIIKLYILPAHRIRFESFFTCGNDTGSISVTFSTANSCHTACNQSALLLPQIAYLDAAQQKYRLSVSRFASGESRLQSQMTLRSAFATLLEVKLCFQSKKEEEKRKKRNCVTDFMWSSFQRDRSG